jgi:hypothetical protein
MNSMKNQGIENKRVAMVAPGGSARKKGGPKMKVYPVMLMKTKVRLSTVFSEAVKL